MNTLDAPYIHEYTVLTPQELRQLKYKRQYKTDVPGWDDSMVLLKNLVGERIRTMLEKPAVLDFGCGRGNFVIDELAESFGEKTGFDVAQESVTGNVSVHKTVIGVPEHLPFTDTSFDVAISLWVFEHVEHPDVVMKEMYRVLKPGGFFAFVTPNKNSLLIMLRRILSDGIAHRLLKVLYGREEKDVFSVYYHMNTIRNATRIAKQAGFTIDVATTNADPSYTSFNAGTYTLSTLLTRFFPALMHPHLVIVVRKP